MNYRKRYDIRSDGDCVVWRGENPLTHELATIKEIARNAVYRDQLIRRLDHECRLLRKIDHSRLLKVHLFDSANGRAIFTDVQCSLRQLVRAQGPLTAGQVGLVMLQAAEALQALHERNLGHGGVNAGSLLLGPQGDVQLGDFLGFDLGAGGQIPAPDRELTFQAPEMLDSTLGQLGPTADLYCLGFAALELLLAERFERLFELPDGADLLAWHADPSKQLVDWQSSLSHIPTGLLDLIGGLIVKPIARRRFKSAAEFADALRRSRLASVQALPFYEHGRVASVEPGSSADRRRRTGRTLRRRPRLVLTALDQRRGVRSFRAGKPVLVGRSQACQLAIDAAAVSSKHALLACQSDGIWRAFDLGSSAGILINGSPQSRCRLQAGEIISFGGVDFRIAIDEPSPLGAVHQFELRELIHEGGQGSLYRADWADRDGRPAAVRVFASDFRADATALRRFLRGIPEAARIRHPNLVRLYRAGVGRLHGKSVWFLAMEYLPGRSLRDRLVASGELEWPLALRIAIDVARGLRALGAHGWVHRNINPACILLAENGTAKLGDFALYRSATPEAERLVTLAAAQLGDTVYHSPEQVNGVSDLCLSSDIYSLGATLFHALTGRPAHDPALPYPELCRTICEQSAPCVRDVASAIPQQVSDLVRRAMATEPRGRFASVDEFINAAKEIKP